MLVDTQFYTFLIMIIILTLTPGMDTMIVIKSTLLKNKKAGILATFGICCGLLIHATLAAFGLSAILLKSEFLYDLLKLIGALYLIYIGLSTLKNFNKIDSYTQKDEKKLSGKIINNPFYEGFFSNLFNPKIAIFFLAFFPQFIDPKDSVLLKSLFLGSVQFLIAFIWLSTLSIFIFKIKNFMLNPFINKIFKTFTGSIFIFFGINLALENTK